MVEFNASLFFFGTKVYLPTMASVSIGWFSTEPVITCHQEQIEICRSIRLLMQHGNPELSADEFALRRKERGAMLKATKLRSWKQLAQASKLYSLVWTEDEIILYYKRQDGKRGAWEGYKTEKFPIETSLESIIQLILNDVASKNLIRE